MPIESSIVVAIIGAIVAILGARWQSKATAKSTLETAEAEFRGDLLAEIKSLRSDIDAIVARNAALVSENARLSAEVITLQGKVERLIQDLTAKQLERDILRRQVENQAKEITQLRNQVEALERELHIEKSRTR